MDSQTRSWFGAVLFFVKELFGVLTRGVAVVDNGIAMADKAVRVARLRQATEVEISMETYLREMRETTALKQVQSHEKLEQFINADSSGRRKELITEARARIDAAIARAQQECGYLVASSEKKSE